VYRCDPPCLAPNHEGLFTHAVKRPSNQVLRRKSTHRMSFRRLMSRLEGASRARDLSESIRQVRLFTHAVKYNMLEIRPPALCAGRVRAPLRWHSHSWLCSVQYATAVMRDRLTAHESASLRTADSKNRSAQIATYLESYSCTNSSATSVESHSCKKSRRAPPPTAIQLGAARVPHPSVSRVRFFPARRRRGVNLATPLLRFASFWQIGFTARSFAAIPGSRINRLRGHEAGSSSPLECAVTQKQGWGVSPPAGFSQ
jgi:hypothetical protein